MKRSEFRAWLEQRLTYQKRVTIIAITAMTVIGGLAMLLEFWLFYGIINYAFIGSRPLAFLIALSIVGGMLFWMWIQTPKRIGGAQHQVTVDDELVTITVAPAMGPVWTYALGSLEIDRSIPERILGVLSMPQRMLSAAWQVWLRYEELNRLVLKDCARVLRLLFQKSERVNVDVIAEECQPENLPLTIHQLSLIDGVVFLTREGVGLSLANRLVDDLKAWKLKQLGEDDDQLFGE